MTLASHLRAGDCGDQVLLEKGEVPKERFVF